MKSLEKTLHAFITSASYGLHSSLAIGTFSCDVLIQVIYRSSDLMFVPLSTIVFIRLKLRHFCCLYGAGSPTLIGCVTNQALSSLL